MKQPVPLIFSFDLETLSTRSNAAMVQIGAAAYVPDKSRLLTFETTLGFNNSENEQGEAHVDTGTLNWWSQAKQQDARAAINAALDVNGPRTRRQAISELRDWMMTVCEDAGTFDEIQVYGNGATFDVSILEYHFYALGWKPLWPFYNIRDLRTLKEMALLAGFEPFSEPRTNHHTALADAEYQLRAIHYYRDALEGLGKI